WYSMRTCCPLRRCACSPIASRKVVYSRPSPSRTTNRVLPERVSNPRTSSIVVTTSMPGSYPVQRDGTGVSESGDRLYPAASDGGLQLLVVAEVLLRVRGRELDKRTIEDGPAAEIRGDRDAVAAARVCARECPGAEAAVVGQTGRRHLLDHGRALPVLQLAHVEVTLQSIEACRDAQPAEEDVARRLHQPLPRDDALAVVGELSGAQETVEYRA